MSLKIHKFARKPFYVDAVRVTEHNMEEVAAWCGGVIKTDNDGNAYIKVEVHRPISPKQSMAYPDDWVLNGTSGYKVYATKAFDKAFEKVKTLNKEQADIAGIKPPIEPSQQPRHPVPDPNNDKREMLVGELAEKTPEEGEEIMPGVVINGSLTFQTRPSMPKPRDPRAAYEQAQVDKLVDP